MKFSDRRKTSQSALAGPSTKTSSKEFVLSDQPSLNGMAMISDGTMYLSAADAKIICVSPNGTVNWTFRPTGLPAIWSSPAVDANGYIYFGTLEGYVYSLTPKGTQNWVLQPTSANFYSAPVVSDDGKLYIGDQQGRVFVISLGGKLLGNFNVGYAVIGIGISDDRTLIVVNERYVTAVNPDTFATIWTSIPVYPEYFATYPTIDRKGNVYVGGNENNLYGISNTGASLWKIKVGPILKGGNWIPTTAALSNSDILYVGNENILYAVTLSGSIVWKKEFKGYYVATTPTVDSTGKIFITTVASAGSNLQALTSSGDILWTLNTGETTMKAPLYYPVIDPAGQVFTYTTNGHIFVVN